MASLTELCSICFTNEPKYTCPRCGCQTCGLECVKTHKKRARCSGVRDPAAYRKSHELATPASIDQDFNFITKVQRDIERAEDGVADRGIALVPAKTGKSVYSGKSKLEIELNACGVTVVRAPTGLSRSKQNRTHWDNRHKCIMWTVEWVLQNGQRVLTNVQGGKAVLDAFATGVGKKGLQKKRRLEGDRHEDDSRPSKQTVVDTEPLAQEPAAEKPVEGEHRDLMTSVEDKEAIEMPQPLEAVQMRATENLADQIHFYLHRPRTSSKWTCLIPISPSTSISDMLRDKTILEFPTIYARHDAEDQLVPPLICEKDYEEQHGIDVVPTVPVFEQGNAITGLGAIPEHIDEGKVMEVLRKDLVV